LARLADLQRTVYPHSGHPSAAGRAQHMVSSPAKDRRSAICATQPTYNQQQVELTTWYYKTAGTCYVKPHTTTTIHPTTGN